MADQYRLRVGIDFSQAKRDIKDFTEESRRQSAALSANVQRQVRETLTNASRVGTPEASRQAGVAIAQIRREIKTIERELDRAFRKAGSSFRLDPAVLRDIDNLLGNRKGLAQYSVGGTKVTKDVRDGLFLPSIRQGFTEDNDAATARLRSEGTVAQRSYNQALQQGRAVQEQKVRALQRELVAIRLNLGHQTRASDLTDDYVSLQSQINAASAQLRNRIQQASREQFAQAGIAYPGGAGARPGAPGPFQRAYAGLHSRAGGVPADPLSSPTLRQFLGQRALTTVGFGLSGGLLYGAISQAREMITEASELQIQLGLVEGMFNDVSDSAEEAAAGFSQFRSSVMETARDTATSASVVADLSRQLAGSFADEQGRPDFERGVREAEVAVQLARVTKLPEQEINDSLTAVALAFETTFTEISDSIIGLSNQYGVSATEIVQFTADLAPVGQALGFTAEQLSAVGAAAQSRTGQSGGSLAEQFRRILPTMQDARAEITGMIADFDKSGEAASAAAEGFASNNLDDVLRAIIGTYQELDKTQQGVFANQIASLVGGRREAGALFALLDGGPRALAALDVNAEDFGGALEDRMVVLRRTVGYAFDEMERAVEELGITLFESGIADAFVLLARALATVADLTGDILRLFGNVNDVLGGIPGQVAAFSTAMWGLVRVYRAYQTARATSTAVSIFGQPGLRNPLAAGGLLSPYSGTTPSPFRGGTLQGAPIPILKPSIANSGALSKLAGAGRFGAAAAGALSLAAPLGAALAGAKALEERAKFGSEQAEREGELIKAIEEGLAAGKSEDEIRRNILSVNGGRIDRSDIRAKIGSFLTSDDRDPIDVSNEYFAKKTAEQRKEQLRALEASLLRRQKERPGYDDVEGEMGQQRVEIERILGDIEADPENYDYSRVLELIEEGEAADAEFALQSGRIATGYERRERERRAAADAAERQTSGRNQLELAEATAIYEAGQSSIQPVLDAIDRDIADSERILKVNPDDYEEMVRLLEKRKARSDVVREAIEADAALTARMAALGGTDTPQANVDLARDVLASLKIGGGSNEAIYEATFALAEAEQAAFMERVNATEDLSARLRLMEEGFNYSETVKRGLVAIQLSRGGTQEELIEVANALMISVDELSREIIDNIILYGQTGTQITRRMLENRLREFRAALNDPAIARNRMAREEFRAIVSQTEATLANLPSYEGIASVAPPPRGGAPAADIRQAREAADAERERAAEEAKRAAEEARREAQAQASANLDVAAARAEGDTLALARIARQKAQVALAYATTGSERTAAYAQIIQADNQIREALQQQVEAQRDLGVARAHDDPVEAARIAVANARDAVRRARGAQAQAEAQAALIRAQRDQRDAILDLADAQTDILIAQAEAAGDTVRAAQLSLDKVRRQLARNDLGLTERRQLEAERVTAEAAVRDARLSEERATIDYQLAIGDITKQQAIGALQSLLTIPKLTEEQIREINLAIKDLRSQLGADFQFNLPTQLGLPTVYEVRRLGDSGGTGGGYQDNRVITVTVNAETGADANEIANTVATVIGDPRRTGTEPRRF